MGSGVHCFELQKSLTGKDNSGVKLMMITSQNIELPNWTLSRVDQPLSDECLKFLELRFARHGFICFRVTSGI